MERWFETCFKQYYASLCRYCVKFVVHPEIAEDIVQQQFVYLWENRDRLQNIQSIGSYMYKAVKNKSLSYLKADSARQFSENNELPSQEHSNSDYEGQEPLELDLLFRSTVKHLPTRCRAVFLMKREYGMSHKQIAEFLSISKKTVEYHMNTAITRLSQMLSSYLS